MITIDLNGSRPLIAASAVALVLTALGVALGLLAPGLAGGTRPHPALSGTLGTAAGILANNVRALGPRSRYGSLGSPLGGSAVTSAIYSYSPSSRPTHSRSGSSWAAGADSSSPTCRSCRSNGRPLRSPWALG